MRKFLIITGIATLSAAIIGCKGAEGNYPGDTYAPDMTYSRAYETYAYNSNDEYYSLKKRGIRYEARPVPGTIARGDMSSYPYPNSDSGYLQSTAFVNSFDTAALSMSTMREAERLYLIHCGICHGTKLDGNGPLWKGGAGPYPAAPRNLLDDYSKKLADGQIYHVITYGKGAMGSYASQVHPDQRWWLVKYIRQKQGSGTAAGGASTDSTATAAGSTAAGSTAAGSTAAGSTATAQK